MREPTGDTATFRRSVRRERGAGPCLGAVILWSVVLVWAGWSSTAAAAARVWADFNGDGFADLAIGIPDEEIGGIDEAGAVQILYGSPSGLQAAGNHVWHQDSPGILDVAETYDRFGWALAAGDFNGDGVDDLAIGIPDEDIGSIFSIYSAGAVQVLYGSPSGLQAAGNQFWHQDSTSLIPAAQLVEVAEAHDRFGAALTPWDFQDVRDVAETYDRFGWALTAGDFNGDGVDDLAIGIPWEDIGGIDEAGAVQVLYGSPGGLRAAGNQFWHQDSPGILDVAEWDDHFGAVLTAGDFNGDGVDDLAIGIPEEAIGSIGYAGAVQVLYGSPSGLQAAGNQFWHQDSPGILDVPERPVLRGEKFGTALTAGDFNGDGIDDLAIGVPGERVADLQGEGAVHILYGSAFGGLNGGTLGNQFWHQDTSGIVDGAEYGDFFGQALTAGDFNGDGFADLAIGIPGEDIGSILSIYAVGAVQVLYGSAIGLRSTGNQFWNQATIGIVDVAEAGDSFGAALTAGDFNGDGADDLAIGIPYEDIGSIDDAGAIQVIYGSTSGLTSAGNQFWHQDSPGIAESAEQDDQFGLSLGH